MRADSAVEKRQEAAGAEPSALSISPSSQLSGKRLRRAVGPPRFAGARGGAQRGTFATAAQKMFLDEEKLLTLSGAR
jgi:hypothetical protein